MEPTNTKGRILLVDDDIHNIEIVRSTLEDDYVIVAAHNGREAIDTIKVTKPDFVLLDWNMPVMDGLETLHHLKNDSETKHIPVVMITGYMTGMDDLLLAYECGVIDFIRKPFDLLELKARANSIFQLSTFYKNEINKRELSLVTYAIRLAEMNEFMLDMISKLQVSKLENLDIYQLIDEIKQSFRSKIVSDSMKKFEDHFFNVHPGFDTNLLMKHPEVSPAEIKLASLLRLSLNTKEISSILYQTPDSVRVSRTRLRKKLHLEPDINLTAYLMNF